MVDVTGLNASAGINNATSKKSDASLGSIANTFDNFLTLLTTQLQNQDPLSPMESTEFTNQLVQFTQVEQQIRQNQNLEAMIVLQHSTLVSSMVSYLGKTVDLKGESVFLTEDTADIAYTLSEGAAKVQIQISDESGNVVRTINIDSATDTTKGAHTYTWDGKTDAGVELTHGSYNVSIKALDGAGNPAKAPNGSPVTVATTSSGKVNNVSILDGQIILTVGSHKIPLAEVTSIRETTSTSTN